MLRRAIRPAVLRAAGLATGSWNDYSRLFLVGEGTSWVIDEEQRSLAAILPGLGVRLGAPWPVSATRRQALFYGTHFTLFDSERYDRGHRIATTYFHGRPGTPGAPEFDRAYARLRADHQRIDRIQVSHRELEDIVLSSGIDRSKVFRIPIGVDLALFAPASAGDRATARANLGLPRDAFVVGSFQKDGNGWGDGLEPKLIKGPDVLVDALANLRRTVPELHVLLSGPARGFVRAGLEQQGIPYVHHVFDRYADVGSLYRALDAYVVPSRQEGGPKGVLESMAAGVPLVSTRVGQATDLVRDGENGWLVDVEDAEALADRLAGIAGDERLAAAVVAEGLTTAAANTYDAQLPLWGAFFDGFVDRR